VKETTMEQAIISGIAHDSSEAKITLLGVPDRPGIAASVFAPLAENDINVDMIVQNTSIEGFTDISFTVPRATADVALEAARAVAAEVGAKGAEIDSTVGKVSLVGAGMKSHPGVAAKVFKVLADASINIEMISTSTIRISCVVREDRIEDAVRVLHEAFEEEMKGAVAHA
jgi:aspartate kinase